MAIQIPQAPPLFEAARNVQMEQGQPVLSTNAFARQDLSAQQAIAQQEQQTNASLANMGLQLAQNLAVVVSEQRAEAALLAQNQITGGFNPEEAVLAMQSTGYNELGNLIIDPQSFDWSNHTLADVMATAAAVSPEYVPSIIEAALPQIRDANSARIGIFGRAHLEQQMDRMFDKARTDAVIDSVQRTTELISAQQQAVLDQHLEHGNFDAYMQAVERGVEMRIYGPRQAAMLISHGEALIPMTDAFNTSTRILTNQGEGQSAAFLEAVFNRDRKLVAEALGEPEDSERVSRLTSMSESGFQELRTRYQQFASDHFNIRNRMWNEQTNQEYAGFAQGVARGEFTWQAFYGLTDRLMGNESPGAQNLILEAHAYLMGMYENEQAAALDSAGAQIQNDILRLMEEYPYAESGWLTEQFQRMVAENPVEMTTPDGEVIRVPALSGTEQEDFRRKYLEPGQRPESFQRAYASIGNTINAVLERMVPESEERGLMEVIARRLLMDRWYDISGDPAQVDEFLRPERLEAAMYGILYSDEMLEEFNVELTAAGMIVSRANLRDYGVNVRRLTAGYSGAARGTNGRREFDATLDAAYPLVADQLQMMSEANSMLLATRLDSRGIQPQRVVYTDNLHPGAEYRAQDFGITSYEALANPDYFHIPAEGSDDYRVTLAFTSTEENERPFMGIYNTRTGVFDPITQLPGIGRLIDPNAFPANTTTTQTTGARTTSVAGVAVTTGGATDSGRENWISNRAREILIESGGRDARAANEQARREWEARN